MAALAPSGHGAEIPSPNRPFPRRRQIEQSPNIQKGSPLKTAAWDSMLRRLNRGARVSKLVVISEGEMSFDYTQAVSRTW